MIMTPEGKPYYFTIAVSEIEKLLAFAKGKNDENRAVVVIHQPNGILGSLYYAEREEFFKWYRNEPNYCSVDCELREIPDFATEFTDWDLA